MTFIHAERTQVATRLKMFRAGSLQVMSKWMTLHGMRGVKTITVDGHTRYSGSNKRTCCGGHLVPPFEAYSGDEPYVFISYAHKDSEFVLDEISILSRC